MCSSRCYNAHTVDIPASQVIIYNICMCIVISYISRLIYTPQWSRLAVVFGILSNPSSTTFLVPAFSHVPGRSAELTAPILAPCECQSVPLARLLKLLCKSSRSHLPRTSPVAAKASAPKSSSPTPRALAPESVIVDIVPLSPLHQWTLDAPLRRSLPNASKTRGQKCRINGVRVVALPPMMERLTSMMHHNAGPLMMSVDGAPLYH